MKIRHFGKMILIIYWSSTCRWASNNDSVRQVLLSDCYSEKMCGLSIYCAGNSLAPQQGFNFRNFESGNVRVAFSDVHRSSEDLLRNFRRNWDSGLANQSTKEPTNGTNVFNIDTTQFSNATFFAMQIVLSMEKKNDKWKKKDKKKLPLGTTDLFLLGSDNTA